MPKIQPTIERRYAPDLGRQVEALRRLIDNRAPAEAIPTQEPASPPAVEPTRGFVNREEGGAGDGDA